MKTFADCEVRYDAVIDHDVPRWLHVTIEVPRGQDTKAIVFLRGKEVGEIILVKDGMISYRYDRKGKKKKLLKTTELGEAAASVITDLL